MPFIGLDALSIYSLSCFHYMIEFSPQEDQRMKTIVRFLTVSILVIVLVSCASPQASQPLTIAAQPAGTETVLNIAWQWGALIETQPASQTFVPQKENYTLIFQPDGVYRFVADCNSGTGKYSVSGSNITLTPDISTLSECGSDSLYSNYLNLLGQATTFAIKEGVLVLSNSDGTAQMLFYNGGPASAQVDSAGSIQGAGIDVNSVSIDTRGLYPSFQTSLALSTPYDNTQPSGAKGLPEHIQVNFGGAGMLETSPTIYIVPIDAYEKLWETAGDPAVAGTVAKLGSLLAEKPEFAPFGMPVLPFERVSGVNDLAVQGAYLTTPSSTGLRFVGRFSQDQQPLSNNALFYIYQGISPDGKYLVTFFYPVKSRILPADGSVTAEDQQAATQDFSSYLSAKSALLKGLTPADFEPNLSVLDEMIKSLTFTTGN
jgi:heat shock protein HslJ